MTTPVSKFKDKKQLRAPLESTREHDSPQYERFRLVNILDNGYKADDLKDTVIKADNLNEEQKGYLLILLNKHKYLFNGSLGDFNDSRY